MGPYKVEEVVLKNAVKLKLPTSMRIHLVVNVSRVERYRELVKGQKVEELKLVEVDGEYIEQEKSKRSGQVFDKI